MHPRLVAPVAALVLFAAAATAQTANTLLLPDLFDLRPAAARADARLAELTAEATLQASLGNPGTAAQIQGIVSFLQLVRAGSVPVPQGNTIEFHVVSFYDGFGSGPGLPGTATVEVDRPGQAVVLVLNAYESIQWTVTATPATTVFAVISYSYEPQILNLPPGTLSAQRSFIVDGDGDYWGTPDDPVENEARIATTAFCVDRLGALPASLVGAYAAPSGTVVVGPANPSWVDQWVVAAAVQEGLVWNVATRANLIAAVQGELFLPLLTPPSGPAAPPTTSLPQVVLASPLSILQPLVPLPAGTSTYALGANFLPFGLGVAGPGFVDFASFSLQPIPPSPTLTPFAFVNTMAYDSVRDRLLVSSFGGGGVLYAWDLATGQWSELANPNNDAPSALVHHPVFDALFGLRIDPFAATPYVLHRYDVNGQIVQSLPLALPVIDYYGEPQQLYAVGNRLAYVGPGRSVLGVTVHHSFLVDPTTGNIDYAGILLR